MLRTLKAKQFPQIGVFVGWIC